MNQPSHRSLDEFPSNDYMPARATSHRPSWSLAIVVTLHVTLCWAPSAKSEPLGIDWGKVDWNAIGQLIVGGGGRTTCPELGKHFKGADLEKLKNTKRIGDPSTELRPGDVIIYARDERKLDKGYPDLYQHGLLGFGHAAVVSKDEKGRPFLLSSPPASNPYDMAGVYYVVRPKVPAEDRDAFEKEMIRLTACFRKQGYDYDAFMNVDYLDKQKLAQMEKWAKSCTSSGKVSPNPLTPQSCAEVTQTITVLAGRPPAKAATARDIIDLSLDQLKKVEKEKFSEAVQIAIDDLIDRYFTGHLTDRKRELEEQIAKADDATARKKEEEELEQTNKQLADAQVAKLLLSQIFMYRLRQKDGTPPTWADGLLKAKAEAYLNQPMIRPADMLLEGLKPDGNYELQGFYPGRWGQCASVLAGNKIRSRPDH